MERLCRKGLQANLTARACPGQTVRGNKHKGGPGHSLSVPPMISLACRRNGACIDMQRAIPVRLT